MNTRTLHIALSALLLLSLALSSTACSVKGEILDEAVSILGSTYPQQTGLVSGSIKNQVVNGYRVSATLGDNMGSSQEIVNGYKVYQSIQGNMNSVTSDTVNQ